jgi:hypothetical protein
VPIRPDLIRRGLARLKPVDWVLIRPDLIGRKAPHWILGPDWS